MIAKLVGFLAVVGICSAQRLQISVYYESLCPDSARFIVEQLHPVKSSPLGRFLDITLIPFGHASYKTRGADVEFQCQHGENECYGNKVHACAIQHIQVNSYQNTKTKESLTLDYVACMMKMANSFKDTTFPGARCAREVQLQNWNVIEECANSTEGSKLLQNHGETTNSLNPKISFVPTITFNHQNEQDNSEAAFRDLRATSCRLMRDPKPYECTSFPSSAVAGTASITTAVVSSLFFLVAKFLQ